LQYGESVITCFPFVHVAGLGRLNSRVYFSEEW